MRLVYFFLLALKNANYISLGVGVSCTYTASSQILALHFDRLKYLAFSLAMLGNYVGMMVWPLLSQLLFKKFGYSQAMGIMTSSHLLHLVAGMSFFEPKESFQGKILNYCLQFAKR